MINQYTPIWACTLVPDVFGNRVSPCSLASSVLTLKLWDFKAGKMVSGSKNHSLEMSGRTL